MNDQCYDSWVLSIREISRLMRLAGARVSQGVEYPLKRESKGNWIPCYALLKLDSLLIFKDRDVSCGIQVMILTVLSDERLAISVPSTRDRPHYIPSKSC